MRVSTSLTSPGVAERKALVRPNGIAAALKGAALHLHAVHVPGLHRLAAVDAAHVPAAVLHTVQRAVGIFHLPQHGVALGHQHREGGGLLVQHGNGEIQIFLHLLHRGHADDRVGHLHRRGVGRQPFAAAEQQRATQHRNAQAGGHGSPPQPEGRFAALAIAGGLLHIAVVHFAHGFQQFFFVHTDTPSPARCSFSFRRMRARRTVTFFSERPTRPAIWRQLSANQ